MTRPTESSRVRTEYDCLNPPEAPDWTVDPETGRSNSSERFRELQKEIGRIIRDDAFTLIRGGSESTAGLILAQLAHKHNFGPLD